MKTKTLAMRILEGKNIDYEVHSYANSVRDAELVADGIGAKREEVYKTLIVVRSTNKPLLVMLPANKQLNLKILANEVGEKKLKMASHHEAEELTGLQVGGISALALLNRGFSIYIDRSAQKLEKIYVSAGQKGLQIHLKTEDLIRVTKARLVDTAG